MFVNDVATGTPVAYDSAQRKSTKSWRSNSVPQLDLPLPSLLPLP